MRVTSTDMGGENNLRYDSTCASPTDPTPVAPSPTPAPTSVVPPIPSPVILNGHCHTVIIHRVGHHFILSIQII